MNYSTELVFDIVHHPSLLVNNRLSAERTRVISFFYPIFNAFCMEKVLVVAIEDAHVLLVPENIPTNDAVFLVVIEASPVLHFRHTPQNCYLMVVILNFLDEYHVVVENQLMNHADEVNDS